MPRFMDVHKGMKGITQAQLDEAHRADEAIQGAEKVRFVQAWADPKSGRIFCLSDAPNREAVERVHKRAGHPADEIYEVPLSTS